MPLTQADIDEERTHFANVIATFQQYAPYAVRVASVCFSRVLPRSCSACRSQLNANNRRRKDIHIIPIEDRELLKQIGYKQRIAATDDAILANAEFLNLLTANPEIFGQDLAEDPVEGRSDRPESSTRHDPRRGQHSHGTAGSLPGANGYQADFI